MTKKVAIVGNITVDRVVRRGKVIGHSPGGTINVAYILKELMSPDDVILVSNIGSDYYAKTYIEKELQKMRNDYVRRVDAETRLYEANVNDPLKPKLTRINDAEKLMNYAYKDLTPELNDLSVIHFQSLTPISEGRYRSRVIKLIKEAYDKGISMSLDLNKRKSIKSDKTEDVEGGVFDKLHTLKMNEEELISLVEPKTKKKPKIRLRKRKIERLVNEIMGTYDLERFVVTRGDRGSYAQTRDNVYTFRALKPGIVMDALGTGDTSATGYLIGYIKNLNEMEIGVLSNFLASLSLENDFSYPHTITTTRMRQALITKRGRKYCDRYNVNYRILAKKLGLI
jgi:sugar/nucleoside kinase (ribokinase family)